MFRIFGPPGTGKTTTLLNMVDDALQKGAAPMSIAFLAFTRKAANEAKERAAKRFHLDPKKDLFYFRTLHSLALTCSDIRPEQVMQDENYRELSDQIGVYIRAGRAPSFDDDLPDMLKMNDPILGLINLARMRKVPLREEYNRSHVELEWNTVNYVAESLKKYKKNLNMYDFTDMLESFTEQGHNFCPNFKLCFVDEAQDLSPLQWDIAHMLDDKSDRMYCAGDDDQAIYRWAGADVDHFIGLEGASDTLAQSYRIPQSVHEVAERIAKRISKRVVKTYHPRTDSVGNVDRVVNVAELDMREGSWLILGQAGYLLAPVAETLKSFGYLFEYRGARSISQKISDAVNGWEQMRKGNEITGDVVKKIYSFMSSNTRIKRGFKKLGSVEDDDIFTLDTLQKNHGLLATTEMVWHVAMDRIPDDDRAYIVALLRRGEKFNGDPRIVISTIHGAKGGEADNVVLFTDLSPAADDTLRWAPDDIHRVFYVGVTRSRNALYIMEPDDATRRYDI